MKSISFDQIKTMLKSMSLTIFKRIQAQERKIDNTLNEFENKISSLSGKIYIGNTHPRSLSSITSLTAWKDATETEQLTYNEGLTLLLNGAHLAVWKKSADGGHELSFVINWIEFTKQSYTKTIAVNYASYLNPGDTPEVRRVILTFVDSTTITD